LSYRFRDGETVFEQASDALSKEDLVNVTQPSPVTGDAQHLLVKILLWRCEFKSPIGDLNVDVLLEKSRVLLNSPALADLDTRQERAVLAGLLRLISAPDWETAQRHLTESVKLFRELGKSWNMARALLLLGDVCQYLGNHDQARQMFDECLATFRTLDNYWGTFEALKQLGGWARGRCEYDQAERYLRESLALSQSKGDRLNTAIALENLGYLALFLGQAAAAADYLCDSLAIFRETGRRVLMPVNLANLSAAYWLAGEFHRARVALDKGIAMATEFEAVGANMVFVRLYAVWLDAITGDYSQARTRMHRLLTRTHGAEYGWMIAMSSGLLGWVALAEMSYKEAREAFQESIARYRSYANREYEAWSLAGLGRAEYGLGNWVEAQQHLHEALRICTDIRAFIPLLYLMPVIPVVLADENNPQLKERAVELYALATSHPFVAKAQLFEDIAGRYVRAATADLPPEVLEAAQARGRALDWWETAEELLQELDW
jgi:tetratricopeptide (TPR) repeat protein